MKEELKVLLSKMAVIEREISKEKGELTFFAMLLPWGYDAWELAASAHWMDQCARFDVIEYIVDKYYAVCDNAERNMIAHVKIIETDDEDMDDILDDYDVEHSMVNIKYSRYFDKEFDRGYIFTCKRRTASRPLHERAHASDQPG